MNRSRTGFFIAALVLLAGAAPPHGLPPCLNRPFEGITRTNEIGEILGEPDRQDWGCVEKSGGAAAGADRAAGLAGVPVPPPPDVCLLPAAPNPTRGAVRFTLSLPAASRVSLVVYGQSQGHGAREVFPVRTLVDAELPGGFHSVQWDGTDETGVRVPAGIYRAVLLVGENALCGDVEVQ